MANHANNPFILFGFVGFVMFGLDLFGFVMFGFDCLHVVSAFGLGLDDGVAHCDHVRRNVRHGSGESADQ